MKPGLVNVLAPGALALLIAGGWVLRSGPPSETGKGGKSVPAASVALSTGSIPTERRPVTEGDEVLQISFLLSGARQPASLFESRQREARERAERLAGRLRQRPDAWNDVLDLLGLLEPEENAVALAGFLADAVDPAAESRILACLRSGTRQARVVALKLLANRKSSESLSAVMSVLEDSEPRLRLVAMFALAQRRTESGDAVDAALARRAQLDPDPVLQDTARRLLGEVVPSRTPAPIAHRAPFSGGIRSGNR